MAGEAMKILNFIDPWHMDVADTMESISADNKDGEFDAIDESKI
jgi:hypothetical protein